MFPLIFCGLCAQKLWRVRTFSGNSPRIKEVFVSEIKESKQKRSSPRNGVVFMSEIRCRPKKGVQPELERCLCPKSLLSVLLLQFHDQQQSVAYAGFFIKNLFVIYTLANI